MPDGADNQAPAADVPTQPPTPPATRVALAKLLSGSAKIISEVLWRQQVDEPPKAPPLPAVIDVDPVSTTLRAIVHGIHHGGDISGHRHTLTRLLYNPEQRAQVIDGLLMVGDYKRVVDLTEARNFLETSLIQSSYRGDLNPAEQLVLLAQIQQLVKGLESKVRSGAQGISDIEGLLRRIDFAANSDTEVLKKKFEQTSPQGREVVRKLALRLQKAVKEAGAIEQEGSATDIP